MINARVETVAERPAYRRAFERFRCLIIADGFYEWQPVPGGPKQPFHITRDDGELFAFAGLWSIWHGDDDEHAAHLHDPDDGRQLGDRPAARPDAGDPRARAPRQPWLDTPPPPTSSIELLARLPADQTAVRAGRARRQRRPLRRPRMPARPPVDAQTTLF